MSYLIFLICLSLPAYLIRFSLFGIPTTLLEIIIYISFIIGLFNFKKAQRINFKIWLPIMLLLLAATISTLVSPDKLVALGQLKAYFVDPILVVWLVLSFLKKEDFIWILSGLAGSSLIVSGFSLYQKIIGQVTDDERVVGIFGYSPNYVALFLGPIIGMVLAHNLELMTKNIAVKDKNLKIVLGWLVVVIDFIAIYLSVSRGAFLALLAGLIFYLIIHFWNKIKQNFCLKISLLVIIVIAIIAAWLVFRPNFLLSPEAGSRVTSSNNIRWQIWQTSIELIGNHPILGIGLGNYQNAFDLLTHNRVNFSAYITPLALSSHNIFLMFWLSTGLLGLIAFIWLLIIFFQKAFQNLDKPIAVVLVTAMAILIFQGFVDTPYFKNDLSLLFWLLFAFMLILN